MATRKRTGRARPDRAERSALLVASKMAKASGPKERAAVEFDRVRATLAHLPDREARQLWSELAGQLASFRQKITESQIHARDSRRDSRR